MRDLDKKVFDNLLGEAGIQLTSIKKIIHAGEEVNRVTFTYDGSVFCINEFMGRGKTAVEMVEGMKQKKEAFVSLLGKHMIMTHVNMIADTIFVKNGYSLYDSKGLFGGYQTIQKAVMIYIDEYELKPLCKKDFKRLYDICVEKVNPHDYEMELMPDDFL